MKKNILLFFISFLGTNSIYSQNEYGILFISDIEARDELQQLTGRHQISFDNDMLDIYPNQYFTPVLGQEDFFYVSPNLSTNKINFIFYSHYKGCFITKNLEFDIIENKNNFNGDEYYFTGCFATTTPLLIHTTTNDNTGFNKCPDDIIELTNGWNWQYSFDGTNWVDFAVNFQEQRGISFKIKELAGFENKTKIYFRTGYKAQFTNILPYDIIPCSPNVVMPIEKENTSCAYNNDGIVSLTFDRPLIENERFEFSFFNNNVLITTPPYTVDTATNKKYTFSGLAAGNYYIKYQTFIGSQPTTVNIEPYPSFTINPATPLTFELKNPKNPSCFGAKDGSVDVLVTSGIPKNFELNGSPATTVKISDTLYRIVELDANALGHKIKVTDANNCIDTNAND
ncbi:hypothetical protein [Flavobacterium sp.]|uniref:hypothetical protein n=1 Tax=Flavobacterium sp. TaxID=239 RepID=UPI0026167194|nr:hypothetical protein [Flavobacterium sp.]